MDKLRVPSMRPHIELWAKNHNLSEEEAILSFLRRNLSSLESTAEFLRENPGVEHPIPLEEVEAAATLCREALEDALRHMHPKVCSSDESTAK
jgi:hypothetical protein